MQNDLNKNEEQQNKEQKNEKKDYRNTMIVSLLIVICFMSVSSTILVTKLEKNKVVTFVAPQESDVRISTISTVTTKGNGVDVKSLINSKNEVTLYPSVTSEEDEVTYTLNVVNEGNTATPLKSIDVRGKNDEHLSYAISNLSVGDLLYAQESHMFTITVKYNEEYTGNLNHDEENVSEIILSLNYD